MNCIDTYGNYSSTSVYHKNLNSLISLVSSNILINNNRYYKFSVGENPNKIYGIAVCREDISLSDCRMCLNNAINRLTKQCSTQKEAIGYYLSRCIWRYSNRPIFGIEEHNPNCTRITAYDIPASGVEMFHQKLSILFKGLRVNASAGDFRSKFATGYEYVNASVQVYGLMQCNPALSQSDCSDCLQAGVKYLDFCCNTVSGARFYAPSCGVEFGNYPFVNIPNKSSKSPPSSSSVSPSRNSRSKQGNIVLFCSYNARRTSSKISVFAFSKYEELIFVKIFSDRSIRNLFRPYRTF